ncbi:MAG: TetR/AcrR family transcriptional regulator [Nitrospirota bacterium]
MGHLKKTKRDEIMQATLELIAEHGFHGAPTAMIAEKANVAIGSIYRYFENKDALVNELYYEIENRIFEAIIANYQKEKPIKERFSHIGEKLLKYLIANPMAFRFVEQFHNSPYGVAVRRERLFAEKNKTGKTDILKELYREGKANQLIKDVQLPVFFALALGALVAVARNHILGFIKLDDHRIDQIVGACWDAVKR